MLCDLEQAFFTSLCLTCCRAKGIQYRREEAVGGWFSQIGHMHSVYHLWGLLPTHTYILNSTSFSFLSLCAAYKSLQDRDETRQNAWTFPGWDECVRRTGLPLSLSSTSDDHCLFSLSPTLSSHDPGDGILHTPTYCLLSSAVAHHFTTDLFPCTFFANFDEMIKFLNLFEGNQLIR